MAKTQLDRNGRVGVLLINRPEVHNCVDDETAVALGTSIESFATDDSLDVLVVAGEGGKSFCSGADLKSSRGLLGHEFVEKGSPMGFARLDPGKPTIAAIEGYCFAGGMELAAWCDFRIASEISEFGALNRRWGVPFIDGGTQRFARIMGIGNALYLIETGARIDAPKAFGLGFVQEVVPAGKALERALELARHIATYPQSSLRADREAMIRGFGTELGVGLELEAGLGRATLTDPEMASGLERFASGRRPEPPR